MSLETIAAPLSDALVWAARRLAEAGENPYEAVQGSLLDNDNYEVWHLAMVSVLVLGLGSLAAGAGIGGGGLFVPLYAFVLGVGAKGAVPLSKATILGGALGNMMCIAFAKHPDPEKNRPLIDYEAATFMQSGELLGVVFGVLLNLILPEIIIIIFLVLLLGFNAFKTLQKGISKFKDESRKRAAAAAGGAAAEADEPKRQISNHSNKSTHTITSRCVEELEFEGCTPRKQPSGMSKGAGPSPRVSPPPQLQAATIGAVELGEKVQVPNEEMQKILAEDGQQWPLWAWGMLAPMTIFTIVYAIVKKEALSVCQPAGYWLWYFSPVPVLGVFMVATAKILGRRHQRRVDAGYHFVGDGEESPEYRDLKWDAQTLKKFPAIAILAGVAAGLLGIGGGMVIGPLFIQLDVQPKVGSSTCAFMILWTAISGVVQYYFAGKLGWQFILYGVVVGFVSGQAGQRMVDAALRKSGRPSFVIFLLGGIVLSATLAMTGTGSYKLIKGIQDGKDLFGFDVSDFTCKN